MTLRMACFVASTAILQGWLTGTSFPQVAAQDDPRPIADYSLAALRVEPAQILAGLAPSRVFLTISNLGPHSVDAASTTLILQYIASPTPNPFDARAVNLTPLVVGIEGAGLEANSGVELDFDALFRSDLALPPQVQGEFHLFALGGPQSDAVHDPNLLNNFIALETPIQVTPRQPSSHHLVFAKDDLENVNALAFRRGMTLGKRECFAFNEGYGNSWRLVCRDGFFECHFLSAREGPALLRVRHLSSLLASAPGRGSAPVTILLNGHPIVSEFDPASQHGGTHDYVDNCWPIHAVQGTNTLTWRAGALTSHYWIQSLEITDAQAAELRLTVDRSAEPRLLLEVRGTPSGTALLQHSTDLHNWSAVPGVPAVQAPWTVELPMVRAWQFLRLAPCDP